MNVIQKAMAEGRPSYGLWAAGPSALAAEKLGNGGLDWILLDLQHGAVNAGDALSLIQAIELGGSSTLVRVTENNPSLIMRALDLGAIGVVVPMISTAEQARVAAEAAAYPPLGTRSFGPFRRYHDPAVASASITCLVMIETEEGLANLDEIAATPGVDGLFVGPVDLGLALGADLAAATASTGIVAEAIGRVVTAANENGIIPGAAGLSPDHAESLLGAGVRLATVGSDLGYITAGLTRDAMRTQEWSERFSNSTPARTGA